jgi:hypothetical protein
LLPLLFAALLAGSAFAADGETETNVKWAQWGTAGHWTVRGSKGACQANSTFEGGTEMGIEMDAEGQTAALYVYNPSWASAFVKGLTYPITIQTETKWGNLVAEGTMPGGLIFSNIDVEVIGEFALANTMAFSWNGRSMGSYDLSHTKRATIMLIECTQAMQAGGDIDTVGNSALLGDL